MDHLLAAPGGARCHVRRNRVAISYRECTGWIRLWAPPSCSIQSYLRQHGSIDRDTGNTHRRQVAGRVLLGSGPDHHASLHFVQPESQTGLILRRLTARYGISEHSRGVHAV